MGVPEGRARTEQAKALQAMREKAEVSPHGFAETTGVHPAWAPTAAWMINSQLLSMGEVWEGQGSH